MEQAARNHYSTLTSKMQSEMMMESLYNKHIMDIINPEVRQSNILVPLMGVRLYEGGIVMRDTLTIGTIAGILGTIVMHLSAMLFKFLGLEKITNLQTSAAIFINWSQVNTTVGFIKNSAAA